jgi:hypothetical protein
MILICPVIMINLQNKKNPTSKETRQELKNYFGISLAIFLFILFFQPFDFSHLNFNNQLLIIAGLGTIIFVFLSLFLLILPTIFPSIFEDHSESLFGNFMGLFISALCSVAFAFYLRYVGIIYLSMFLMFKVLLICVTPYVVLKIINYQVSLKETIFDLKESNNRLKSLLADFQHEETVKAVEIYSENKAEKLALEINSLLLIRSADNYIEIIYNEDDQYKKKLIRNSLKNIEDQLSKYTNFIRCHRTYILNSNHIEKLVKSYSGYKIRLRNFPEEIPVSRQFHLKVKEAIMKD